jgi:hypothetical protein
MPGGFGPRFAIEAGFLIALGVGAGIADLRPLKIIALLAGGWLLVSLFELAVWRAQTRPPAVFVPYAPPPEPDEQPPPAPEPAAETVEADDTAYPLRADAGSSPSAEVEAYTRVLDPQAEPRASEEAAEGTGAPPTDRSGS